MKKRRIFALLMTLVLAIGLMSGCGNKDDKAKDDANQGGTVDENKGSGTEDDKKTDDTKPEDNGQGNTAEAGTVTLPITDEKVNFSMWVVWSSEYMDSPNDAKAVQKLEELTNVHIDYVTVSTQEALEKFGLMIASGDIPDMVKQADQYYPSGIAKAIDDGIFMDVTDAVQQYMPIYLETVKTHPDAMKGYVSDDGRNEVVWGLNGNDEGLEHQKTYLGLLIRQDWLDELNLEMPETIEDWHTVLTAFKEKKGAEAPLMIGPEGRVYGGAFMSAYDVMPEFYAVDGEVKYGPAEPGYKDWLETFRQWYAEGLIDQNFTANNSETMADHSYMATGKAGAGNSLFIFGGQYYKDTGMTTDEINYVGAPMPVMNEGDAPRSNYNGSRITGDSIAFSPDIKNLEVALKWLDYQYTDEAMVLNNYGIEGDSYTLNETGTPRYQFTDVVLNNADGYTPADALKFYCPRIPAGRYNWQYEEQFYDESVLNIEDVWSQANVDWVIPPEMTMTEEEGNTYNSVYTNIKTLVDEMTVKYILGTESLDNYDNFVAQLEQYGLQQCIDVKQAAYDRYQAR